MQSGVILYKEIDGVPKEIQVIPYGRTETDKGEFVLDAEGMARVVADFEARKNDMVIDYEHQTLGGVEAPAAGWIRKLLNKGKEGLWAVVEWTPRAAGYLKDREYRYLSPVFLKRKSDGRVVRLINAALTNQPAIDGMVAIVNRETPGAVAPHGVVAAEAGARQPESMDSCLGGNDEKDKEVSMNRLLTELGLQSGASEEDALGAVGALKQRAARAAHEEVLAELGLSPDATLSDTVATVAAMKQAVSRAEEHEALRAEVDELRRALAGREAEELVAASMKAGKVTPAQKDWATRYAHRDPQGFRTFVAKAPVVVPRGERAAPGPAGLAAPDALQASVNRLLMVSDEAFRKYDKHKEV